MNNRRDASVEQLHKVLKHHETHTRAARSERARPQKHQRADDFPLNFWPGSGGVGADQARLQ